MPPRERCEACPSRAEWVTWAGGVRQGRSDRVELTPLLEQAVQYQLARYGPDCDLKRFGLKLLDKGGPKSRNRAVIVSGSRDPP